MEYNKDNITVFVERLQKIGIDVAIAGNVPWIYLTTINGMPVKEKFQAKHGFTIAFLSIKPDGVTKFTDIGEIFKLIRKYVC